MNEQEILEKLSPIFQNVFNDDELKLNMELTSEDIDEWSSLSQTLMITEVEKEFGITFKLREVAVMDNMDTIVKLIQNKLE